MDDLVPLGKTIERIEAHAALSWWFTNDKESHEQELQSLSISHRWKIPLQTTIYLS